MSDRASRTNGGGFRCGFGRLGQSRTDIAAQVGRSAVTQSFVTNEEPRRAEIAQVGETFRAIGEMLIDLKDIRRVQLAIVVGVQ